MDDIPMFRELANKYVGDVNFDKIFPLAKHYDISYQNTLPPGFAMALRQNSLRDMVEVLFGKTRYRKDLAKAVAQSFPQAIMMGVDFRGLVPIDWIIDFLRNNRRVLSYPVKYPSVRNILLRLDRRSYPALLREQLDWATLLHVCDVTSGYNQYGVEVPPQRIRSWEQFHNLIWQQIRDNETSLSSIVPKDAPIPLTDLAQQLSGLTVDGYTVVVPERAEELYVWGHEMRNCIGGYAKLVLHEGSKETLGAITSNGRVVVNFEVHDGKLRQFLGKCNQDPPVEIAKKFEPVFQSLGVSTNSYLGKPR
jgi:hypothetical protein